MTAAQAVGVSFFMSFGSALFLCGLLFYMARRRAQAALLIIGGFAGMAAYTVIYALAPVPVEWAVGAHLIINLVAGIAIYRYQARLLKDYPKYDFWAPTRPKTEISQNLRDGLSIGIIVYLIALPIIFSLYISGDFDRAMKMRGMFGALYKALWGFPFGFVAGAFWSRRKGGLKAANVFYFFSGIFAILIVGAFDLTWNSLFPSGEILSCTDLDWASYIVASVAALAVCLFLSNEETAKSFFKRCLVLIIPLFFVFWHDALIAQNHLGAAEKAAQKYGAREDARSLKRAVFFNSMMIWRAPESPQAADWLAARASQRYRSGAPEKAAADYRQIINRYGKDLSRYNEVRDAKFILKRLSAGNAGSKAKKVAGLQPLLREDYLTPNWLSLLTAAQYLEKGVDEKKLKERLLRISMERKIIKLGPIRNAADARANMEFLGYKFYLARGDMKLVKKLVGLNVPVVAHLPGKRESDRVTPCPDCGRIHDDSGFNRYNDDEDMTEKSLYVLVTGYDDKRGVLTAFDFSQKDKAQKKALTEGEIKDIVYQKKGRDGADIKKDLTRRLRELRGEIYSEYAYPAFEDKWRDEDREIAIILPANKAAAILRQAGMSEAKLNAETQQLTYTALGDYFFDNDDYTQALKYYLKASGIFDSDNNTTGRLETRRFALAAFAAERDKLQRSWQSDLERYSGADEYDALLKAPGVDESVRRAERDFISDFNAGRLELATLKKFESLLVEGVDTDRVMMETAYLQMERLDPEDLYPADMLAQRYTEERNYKAAMGQWRRLVDLTKNDRDPSGEKDLKEARINYAMCAVEAGHSSVADKQLDEASDLFNDSESDIYYYTRGRIELADGDAKAARRDFERAISREYYDARYHMYLAKALKKLGDRRGMKRELEWVRKIEIDGPLARAAKTVGTEAKHK